MTLRRISLTLLLILLLASACRPGVSPSPTPEPTRAGATSTPTPTPVNTPTPYIFPDEVAARDSTCDGAPVTRLILQERGRVTNEDERPLRMRSEPGTQNDIVATLSVGDVFLVLEGPTCNQSYSWYRIRFEGEEGWIAEGDRQVYYVEPYLPG